ncbi:hypothetical protein DFH09DRAFT_1288015 [Mycena vulgaris]|nr:hypothetical protein DFH09DRAFT_1288015 [Mycena vulgaris]
MAGALASGNDVLGQAFFWIIRVAARAQRPVTTISRGWRRPPLASTPHPGITQTEGSNPANPTRHLPTSLSSGSSRIEQIKEVPLVITSESFTETKEAVTLLKSLNAYAEVIMVSNSCQLRAGEGKMRNRRHRQRRGPSTSTTRTTASSRPSATCPVSSQDGDCAERSRIRMGLGDRRTPRDFATPRFPQETLSKAASRMPTSATAMQTWRPRKLLEAERKRRVRRRCGEDTPTQVLRACARFRGCEITTPTPSPGRRISLRSLRSVLHLQKKNHPQANGVVNGGAAGLVYHLRVTRSSQFQPREPEPEPESDPSAMRALGRRRSAARMDTLLHSPGRLLQRDSSGRDLKNLKYERRHLKNPAREEYLLSLESHPSGESPGPSASESQGPNDGVNTRRCDFWDGHEIQDGRSRN